MVCLGNICRSPMAEGIMRKKLTEHNISPVKVDSAGTGNWHAGENPDIRAIKTMKKYQIDISNLTARQFRKNDFNHFDLILAMDESNYEDILNSAPNEPSRNKVKLILKYTNRSHDFSVPDPWYGDHHDFEQVYHLLNHACEEVIKHHFK